MYSTRSVSSGHRKGGEGTVTFIKDFNNFSLKHVNISGDIFDFNLILSMKYKIIRLPSTFVFRYENSKNKRNKYL